VDVLVVDVEDERAGLYVVADAQKTRTNRLEVLGRNDALGRQHLRMGDRAQNVLQVQLLVNGQRRPESLGERVNALFESA